MLKIYLDIFWTFLILGCTSFGGPIAHLAYFRVAFVEQKKWLSEQEYAQILTICQTLPGPASSQVGFSIGLTRGGYVGALLAFVGFTLPSVLLLIIFASQLSVFSADLGQSVLNGLAILAFVVVLQGVLGMARQLCHTQLTLSIALVVFVALVLHQSLIVQILAIVFGSIFAFLFAKPPETINKAVDTPLSKPSAKFAQHTNVLSIRSAIVCAFLFVAFLAGLPFFSGLFFAPAAGFYQSGSLVFGGGHVVLPLLEQMSVQPGLLERQAFLAGYGATQAVPGPMFSFAAYLGYLWPTADSSMLSAISNAFWATAFIFLPGFLLVGAVLPIWQYVMHKPFIQKCIVGANAAVVGLLAATLYDPIFTHAISSSTDVAIAAICFVLLHRFRFPVLFIVFASVLLSVLASLLGL
ncbi:chromate efflux transporter [Glaciecola petra]|uniref:Chromate efflux transporter n=1 Tax=Glaciecola petra TaxID=3075602 RepID=A0ABU2ZWD3_9ALTE|nr:chromate efflux transporter [Aestuariibacter sp. P117]MDT0596619.1 chromate efflux transporter [Aestuariibacter sp. P117]